MFGECKLHKYTYNNCAVRYAKLDNGDGTMDQDDYVKQLRPIQHPDLAGSAPEEKGYQDCD